MINKVYELYALEKLAAGNTCIHRLHPLVKLIVTGVFIVTVVSFDRYSFSRLVPYIFYTMLLRVLSETPYTMLVKRFLVALPFCLFAGISNVLFDRAAAFAIGDLIISYGVISLVTILFKTYLCVMAVLLLVSVTPFSVLSGEMRRLRMPGIFVTMFEMTYRYIGVLLNEAHSMGMAYSLRSRGGIEMRDMGSFTGQLLIRSFDRAGRVYNAMKCRGFLLQSIPHNNKSLNLKDIIYLGVVTMLCVSFRVVDVNNVFVMFLGNYL